ncbi:MAG: hypothetical protein GXP37_04475, partial [Chloroflexi bacterium]|nr:hypothetical protein [Chloroflexota bacterium]
IISNNVDLPDPLRPIIPTVSPPTSAPATPLPPAQPLARWIIAAGLLVAIMIGLQLQDGSVGIAPRRPSVTAAFQTIEALPPDARVLLAWDYEPTTQGEMQLLAGPILDHLLLKQAHIANISLRPTGPAVARTALAAAGLEGLTFDIGFIPGEASALRALSIAPFALAPYPETQIEAQGWQVRGDITQFDLIIEFSAETATTRAWVEQVVARGQTPLIVAASGAVAPTLRPYEQSAQITALLSGYTDALAYEQWLGESGPATAQRLAQTLARLLFLVIIVFALIRPTGCRHE